MLFVFLFFVVFVLHLFFLLNETQMDFFVYFPKTSFDTIFALYLVNSSETYAFGAILVVLNNCFFGSC